MKNSIIMLMAVLALAVGLSLAGCTSKKMKSDTMQLDHPSSRPYAYIQ